jgi:hypothetical protein
MKQIEIVAKSKNIEVGRKTINYFENVGEAVAELTEKKVLSLVNYAYKIQELNSMRKPEGGGGKTAQKVLREKLLAVKAMVDAGTVPQTVLDEMFKLLGVDASIIA